MILIRIWDSINRVPGGLMIIPLILGSLVKTFFPSPDQGTVLGKAGTGLADEKATLEAIKLAIQISENLENNC
ncbi:MAG: 2-keto-3-deoxygluconate permease [Fervidicoccaceae archaeon]